MAPPKSNEKKIRQLCEMGCSRAAAKSALRASKWDFEEVCTYHGLSQGPVLERQHRTAVTVLIH